MSIHPTKFIFITGGVVSSLGKGITAASLGMLLKSQGLKVTIQKFDPYLNVDPGTMSPYQHGEVFVTEDGCETDLDLGHYERFVDQNLTRLNNVTSGMIFWDVLTKERKGEYLGHTVQIIPHVTNEIKARITAALENEHFDVVITEIGGTIGDIESLPFLEAIRQFQFEHKNDSIQIHVTLVPYLTTSGEFKTKPTQHSVKELRAIGIHPDVIVCRSFQPLTYDLKQKIALFCDVTTDAVITAVDVDSIYDVPLILENEKLDQVVLEKLKLEKHPNELTEWKKFIKVIHTPDLEVVKIALVGKYTSLADAYLSVAEALKHAAAVHHCKVDIKWVDSEDIERDGPEAYLSDVAGILIPGGFGSRGVEGKILSSQFARTKDIPYLGLCLGMHIAVIEFGRHVLRLEGANSSEISKKTPHPVIDLLDTQRKVNQKGGTMRLGAYPCVIKSGTKLFDSYKTRLIEERHRHRYEFNNAYRADFEAQGMVFSGTSPDEQLVEVIELTNQKWYVACQFHPEFKSRPQRAHPLFRDFIGAAKQSETVERT